MDARISYGSSTDLDNARESAKNAGVEVRSFDLSNGTLDVCAPGILAFTVERPGPNLAVHVSVEPPHIDPNAFLGFAVSMTVNPQER